MVIYEIDSKELVPGDIVAQKLVMLYQQTTLFVVEANSLLKSKKQPTGESVPVEKTWQSSLLQ